MFFKLIDANGKMFIESATGDRVPSIGEPIRGAGDFIVGKIDTELVPGTGGGMVMITCIYAARNKVASLSKK